MQSKTLIDKHGSPLATHRPKVATRAAIGRAYEAASLTSQSHGGWRPQRHAPQSALSVDRNMMVARTEDMGRNNPWASAALQRKLEMVIGIGWKFASRPNSKRLGISKEQARDLSDEIEAWIAAYCGDTELRNDAAQRESVAMQMGSAFKHCLVTGDALGRLHYLERGGEAHTALELIHSARLKQPLGTPPTDRFRDGIELGQHNEALAYWFTVAHPNDTLSLFRQTESVRIAKYDEDGTRRILHYFTPQEPGEFRGRSLLAPIVKKLRQLAKFDEAELQAATLNAILAAFVETDAKHDVIEHLIGDADSIEQAEAGVATYFDTLAAQQEVYRQTNPLEMDGVRFMQTAIGEKVNFTNPARPSAGYDKFEMAALRNVASATNLSLEMLTADYSKLSYSGWRGAITNIWRGVTCERSGFEATFVRPWFRVVIEEGIARGKIRVPRGAPSFWDMPSAYLSGDWIGPGRGSADPYKDGRAEDLEMKIGVKTKRKILAERGEDYDEHMDNLMAEIEDHQKRGIRHPAEGDPPPIEPELMRDDAPASNKGDEDE
ncbi:phage portal protein, lambda family [Cohaesibacter sp. ES.047]|uniref:phage portal protein n=1 Tax=Cohaesibacter sp. ES.047 TaxID=1798205 RepID=UPI000BB7E473|nr:phage portal protein [Cohaesibacter sp. ES.047]SNY93414.1 phage portal protein, lambda family [Cohaesibacter sp. ES.047]